MKDEENADDSSKINQLLQGNDAEEHEAEEEKENVNDILERLNGLEWIINQQHQEIKILWKKNTMLKKTIENMKDDDTIMKQANDLKLKMEEDFYKEVIEAK